MFIQIDSLPIKNKIVFFDGDMVQANGTESSVNRWWHESRMKMAHFDQQFFSAGAIGCFRKRGSHLAADCGHHEILLIAC